MAKGHAGFISIFETGSWGGSSPYDPQLLTVESDTISFGKDIKRRPDQVALGRSFRSHIFVDGPEKPEGDITIELKAADACKFLMAHFQSGEAEPASYSPNRYTFSPLRGNVNYNNGDWFSDTGPYGTGAIYSVTLLRKYFQTTQNAGTNSVLFRSGIVDKLSIELSAEDTARMTASLKFRDMVVGTAVPDLPGTVVGTYSSDKKFESWSGTVLIDGNPFEISGINIEMSNNLEERSRVGKKNPENWAFGRHEVQGQLAFDMPKDGLQHIGSMLSLKKFGIIGTLRADANNLLIFSMPYCVRQSFDTTNSGNQTYGMTIPFQAFESDSNESITITVATDYEFQGLEQVWDAWYGARTLAEFEIIDAEYGTRTLSEYEIADRDA